MYKILVTFLSGLFAVLITGMLFYRFDIFNVHSPNLQFVSAGMIASILYPTALYSEKRNIVYISFLLAVFHFIIFKPGSVQFIIRDLIYLLSIISAVLVYVFYILPLIKRYKAVKIFALPFIFGIFYILAFLLLALETYFFFDTPIKDFGGMLLWFLRFGVMIGFGLSVGFNFGEFIIKNYIE